MADRQLASHPASMPRVIRVVVPRPLRSGFDYAVPDDWPAPGLGARVRVPFSGGEAVGIITAVDPDDAHSALKPAAELIDASPLIPDDLQALAHWLASYYHHPLGEVFSTLLPGDVRRGIEPAKARGERYWRSAANSPDLSRAPAQREALALIQHTEPAAEADLKASGVTARALKELAARAAIIETTAPEPAREAALEPTDEQAAALSAIDLAAGFTCSLLDGVTGSGKTEVYLQLIQRTLDRGDQALVLVPEISLTPQTIARFERRFGRSDVLHSQLTDAQRARIWLRCARGDTQILVGTRSAVFAPLSKLGLIVIDEEHDGSFKQQEGLRYNARDVALVRARNLDIPIVLGSATPAIETLANAQAGRFKHLRLTSRAGNADLPAPRVLDVRGHSLTGGLSPELIRRTRAHLDAGGQALIFLNRRGFAPALLCTDCRWQARCPDCDANTTLHERPPKLQCHHCGQISPVPTACPSCESTALTAVGAGTQRVEAELAARFADVEMIRIDRDSTRSRVQLEAHLNRINSGDPLLLVGTQMLAKGHHFPNVTLVVVLGIDGALTSVDFRAPERIAALLTQVAGRAGRAERPGEVWIQSLQPEHPLFAALADGGYGGFAEQELAMRQQAGLPPASSMAVIRAEAPLEQAGFDCLSALNLHAVAPEGVSVLGPAPAPMHRREDRYRWQLLLMASNRRALHGVLASAVAALGRNKDRRLRWSVDVDPLDTL